MTQKNNVLRLKIAQFLSDYFEGNQNKDGYFHSRLRKEIIPCLM